MGRWNSVVRIVQFDNENLNVRMPQVSRPGSSRRIRSTACLEKPRVGVYNYIQRGTFRRTMPLHGVPASCTTNREVEGPRVWYKEGSGMGAADLTAMDLEVVFFTHTLCPYAERVWLSLLEKVGECCVMRSGA